MQRRAQLAPVRTASREGGGHASTEKYCFDRDCVLRRGIHQVGGEREPLRLLSNQSATSFRGHGSFSGLGGRGKASLFDFRDRRVSQGTRLSECAQQNVRNWGTNAQLSPLCRLAWERSSTMARIRLQSIRHCRWPQTRRLSKNPTCAPTRKGPGTAADFRVLGSTHLCSEPVYSEFSPATEHGLSIVYIKYIESVWVLSTPGQIRMWRNANDTV